MKKILSILLVIAMTAVFFAGCNKATPEPSTDASPTPTPIEDSNVNTKRPQYDGEIIEFNLYNQGDYMTRWNDVTFEWMLNNYQIKVGAAIPGIAAEISSESGRKNYNAAISNLFIAIDSAPDYMPALRGSAIGADVCFKELGSDYLVDFNPYLGEGGILENYVKWVWGGESKLGLWDDATEYWETAKKALESDGALYALPRRECMPIQNYLGYATVLLEQINVKEEDLPTTWDGFVELLTKFKNYKEGSVPLTAYQGKASNILAFVATTYGLDFNEDFSWTEKNGEPLWTYYWDEYLEILKNVKDLAAQGLVATDKSAGTGVIINYDFDYTSRTYKDYKNKSDKNGMAGNTIAVYTTSSNMAIWSSDMRDNPHKTEWKVTDKLIAQNGKNPSLTGTSQFDSQVYSMGGYIAIGNRLGEEFALRIMDMLSYSMSDEGYMSYFFGKEGTPFVDSIWDEKAGCYVYDENGKLRMWHDDRLGFVENIDFWKAIDSHASALAETGYPENIAVNANAASDYGITDTGFWANGNNWKYGTMLQADVTSWPMKLTAYWHQESMSSDSANIEKNNSRVINDGSVIYQGFYRTPTELLGSAEGKDIKTKIEALQTIARNFTVGFLKGEKTTSSWDSYIKDLKAAGYDDVYEFYKAASYGFTTVSKDGVESQSYANAQKNK